MADREDIERKRSANRPNLDGSPPLSPLDAAQDQAAEEPSLALPPRRNFSIHPDFDFSLMGWKWNSRVDGTWVILSNYKVRFFFTEDQLSLLDNCPFACKIRRNRGSTNSFEFCGQVFPRIDHELPDVERWASQFPRAELFTAGSYEGKERVPGRFLRLVSGAKARR